MSAAQEYDAVDSEAEAAVADASAETGLIHLPLRHGDREEDDAAKSKNEYDDAEDGSEREPLYEREAYPADQDALDARAEELDAYGSPAEDEAERDDLDEPEQVMPEQVSTYESGTEAPTAADDLAARMHTIQLSFIDDPRRAALDATDLLDEVVKAFADDLAQRRRALASPDGAGADTESLRQTVRRSRELADLLGQAR